MGFSLGRLIPDSLRTGTKSSHPPLSVEGYSFPPCDPNSTLPKSRSSSISRRSSLDAVTYESENLPGQPGTTKSGPLSFQSRTFESGRANETMVNKPYKAFSPAVDKIRENGKLIELLDDPGVELYYWGRVGNSAQNTDISVLELRVLLYHPNKEDTCLLWKMVVCGDCVIGDQYVMTPQSRDPSFSFPSASLIEVGDDFLLATLRKGKLSMKTLIKSFPNPLSGQADLPGFAKESQRSQLQNAIDAAGNEAWSAWKLMRSDEQENRQRMQEARKRRRLRWFGLGR